MALFPCPTCPGHTLSLSCWQSCRETVKYTRASLSQGITHSTLWTWLTSRRCEPHSLWGGGVIRSGSLRVGLDPRPQE